jgi:hypothetical protein
MPSRLLEIAGTSFAQIGETPQLRKIPSDICARPDENESARLNHCHAELFPVLKPRSCPRTAGRPFAQF